MPPRPRKTDAGGRARTVLRDAINEQLTPERVTALIEDAFGAKKTELMECPSCGKAFKAPAPDVKKAVDSITALIQEAEGRPEQRAPEATKITILRPPL